MGNTPSHQQQNTDIYSSYIHQQQDLIYKQQQQINELYKFNLQSQQQMPSNMFFQSDVQQQQQQQQQQHQQQYQLPSQNIPQLPPAKTKYKLDPYKILGISKEYDETTLKKAYLRAAMKSHPDRGGSALAFQQVSIAYTLLTKKLKEQNNNHSHNDLRDHSRDYSQQQMNQPKVNINMKDNFDADVFNKIYEDNKISDVYDEGYGNWMNDNPALESGQQKLFQNGFNKDMFNSTFENYKQQQSQENKHQVVQYQQPETRISMANQDSMVTLGQGKVTDFSGESSNLQFTDYKKAFTDGSTLIDTSTVSLQGRSNDINGIKSQRSNLSYQLSPEDQQKVAIQQMRDQQEEDKRTSRLNVYDQKSGQAYERIHSMLLR
jgi:curved DNA-binding protein CbpA